MFVLILTAMIALGGYFLMRYYNETVTLHIYDKNKEHLYTIDNIKRKNAEEVAKSLANCYGRTYKMLKC